MTFNEGNHENSSRILESREKINYQAVNAGKKKDFLGIICWALSGLKEFGEYRRHRQLNNPSA